VILKDFQITYLFEIIKNHVVFWKEDSSQDESILAPWYWKIFDESILAFWNWKIFVNVCSFDYFFSSKSCIGLFWASSLLKSFKRNQSMIVYISYSNLFFSVVSYPRNYVLLLHPSSSSLNRLSYGLVWSCPEQM